MNKKNQQPSSNDKISKREAKALKTTPAASAKEIKQERTRNEIKAQKFWASQKDRAKQAKPDS